MIQEDAIRKINKSGSRLSMWNNTAVIADPVLQAFFDKFKEGNVYAAPKPVPTVSIHLPSS